MTPEELWARLAAVTESRLHVEEGGAERRGTAAVIVHRPDPRQLVWEESGAWEDERGRTTRYHDRVQWHWGPQRGILALHHSRRGDDAAVHLGDLALAPDGSWRSMAPHRCGADQYDAVLSANDGAITLVWRVKGPRKNYLVVRRYTQESFITTPRQDETSLP